MRLLNPPKTPQNGFLLQEFYYFVYIVCVVVPAIAFLWVNWGLQDIYWEKCPSPTPGTQPHHSAGFNIINDSFFKSPPLTFTVTVDVPPAKVAAAKTSDELSKLLKDPNTLTINLSDNKNTLQGKHPFGTDCTIVEISRTAGLVGRNATMINFLWQRGKNVRFIDVQLYSGTPTSPYYKKYPDASERKLLAQTKWQIIICLAITGTAILTTILVKMLLSTKTKLSNKEKELTNMDIKLGKTQKELDKALLSIQYFEVSLKDSDARRDYVASKPETEIQPLPEGVSLPVEEDVAEEYQQKTQEETTEEMTRGKQKSPKDQTARKPIKTAKKKKKKKH